MSNLFKKAVAGISSVAVAVSILVPASATLAAPMAGETYKTTDGTVWFITKDMKKVPFTSWGAYQTYSFLSGQTLKDADASVTALPTGDFVKPRDGSIFCATETKGTDVKGECAFITGGKKAAFVSEAVFSGLGFSFSRAMYGDSSFLAKASNIDNASAAHPAGTLINDNGTYRIVVSGGTWGIPSPAVLTSWGYSFADGVMANSADKALKETGVIPTRVAGELVPSAAAGGVTPVTAAGCPSDNSEGSVDSYAVGSPQDTTIAEDQSKVEVVAYDVKLANDGDLCVNRFDLYMGQDDGVTASSKPWDYFTKAYLMVDGKEVSSMDVSSSSDWVEYDGNALTTGNQEYRLRFSGMNSVLPKDATSTVSVAFDTASTIDSADTDAVWQFGVEADSFRFTDGTGFSFTGGDATKDSSFSFEAPKMAALQLSVAADDPKAAVIQVSDSTDTSGETIGMFDIKETGGVDTNITEMTVGLGTSDTITDVARTVYLYNGSDKVGQENVTGGTVTFDNLNLNVKADSTVTLTVKVDLKDTNDQVRYQDGDTISVTSVNLTKYTDEYDNDQNDFTETGSYAGQTHTLYANGISVEVVGNPTTAITDDGDGTTYVSGAEFQWVVDVTAFGKKDIYINKDIADIVSSGDANDVDTIYSIEKSGGAALTSLSGTIVRTSGSSTDANGDDSAYGGKYNGETFFKIVSGSTHRFTITVSGSNQTDAKQVRALLNNIEWTSDEVTAATSKDGATATINSYTVGLGSDAATPFKLIQ